jgi:hypothetical protein
MLGNSALLSWFFTLVLLALAARATARLLLARGSGELTGAARDAEVSHAAMGFGMAVLLVPGLPRPPTAVSLSFFAALTVFAVFAWVRRAASRLRGQMTNCGCAPKDSAHLLDPHHAVVGAAMIVMLLRPAAGMAMDSMPGMTTMPPTGAPGVAVLVFLAYVWVAALVLGYGMTKLLPATVGVNGSGTGALLGSPATVYGCELAMTVLTGLMLLS